MKAKYKAGAKVTVKGEDFSYTAVIIKALPRQHKLQDEVLYRIKDTSVRPPMEVEEYEGYIFPRVRSKK